ncbi:MAG: 2-methylcitrate dehydratase PrpD [Gammaproteobacteria bacterium]
MKNEEDPAMADQTTQRLARFILDTELQDLPAGVQHEAVRTFVNWMGCTLGGSTHPSTRMAVDVTQEFAGPASATLIGIDRRFDALNTAFINSLSSSANSFDDTHLATVIHPTGPVAATVFALAERMAARDEKMSGEDLQLAIALGIEVACQLGVALLVPPAKGQLGWYMTGVAAGMGAAAAAARVLGLSHEQTCWALGLAGNQASGFRQTHGSMCTSFVPGHAARCGMYAALMAQGGITASLGAIEGVNGYAQLFSVAPNLDAITNNLGKVWELLSNAYKPYPSGIVIHPVIDAALALHTNDAFSAETIERIDVEVNPLCLTLCDRPAPASDQDGQVSLQHWTAVTLLRGKAGLAEGALEAVLDADVIAMRARVQPHPTQGIERDGARVTLTLRNGTTISEFIEHASGSLDRPMSDDALADKFLDQAGVVLDSERAKQLLGLCQQLPQLDDVAQLGPLTLA